MANSPGASTGPPPGPQPAPGSGPGSGPQGVIHDIGYRHYEGDRLGGGYVLRSLYSNSLRSAFGLGRTAKSKVLPLGLFSIMCLTAAIIVIVTIAAELDSLPVPYTRFFMIMLPVIAIYLAGQAPQQVSHDLRFHVVPLYFARPLTAGGYALAKYAAMATALLIVTGVPLLVLYAGALLAELPVWENTTQVAEGLAGVLLLSLVLAGVGLLIAALTPRRGFGVAAVVAVLMLSYTVVSSVQGISQAEGALATGGWLGLFSPFTLVDGVQVWLFGVEPSTPTPPQGDLAGAVFLLVALAIAAVSLGLLTLRYRKVGVT
jgi:ABC-2 type transport system permease protein